MRLTESQKKEVCEILRNLKDQLGDREITAENVAAVMLEFCENLDPESAGELCGRIREGAEKFYSLCADGRVRTEPDFAEKMLEEITEQMDDAQRKGFYLQSLDAFDKYRASAEETAARASLPTDELRDMLADRIREFSGTLVSGMRDSVSASRSGYAAGKEQRSAAGAGETDAQEAVLPAQKEFLEEALLYAAAVSAGYCPGSSAHIRSCLGSVRHPRERFCGTVRYMRRKRTGRRRRRRCAMCSARQPGRRFCSGPQWSAQRRNRCS